MATFFNWLGNLLLDRLLGSLGRLLGQKQITTSDNSPQTVKVKVKFEAVVEVGRDTPATFDITEIGDDSATISDAD